MVMSVNKDDLFFVCTMIEYVSRTTHNRSRDVVARMSDEELMHQLRVANVNHCLSFEQVCDEWIEQFDIKEGNFDNISSCKYKVPAVTSIGKVFQRLILPGHTQAINLIEDIRKVYNSFISDEISDYNSSLYCSNPDYIKCSYEAGTILA